MDSTQQLAIILPMLTNVVGRIEPSQLDAPTPCARFSVRDVLDHMIGGATAFAPAFRGDPPAQAPTTGASTASGTAGHPAPRFRSAMAELLDAVQTPGALTREVDAPFGRVPGDVFARFVAFDGLIHGWDLASATGQAYDPPAEVVAAIDGFARAALSPDMRDGDTFAAEADVAADASPLIKLVAFSGRQV